MRFSRPVTGRPVSAARRTAAVAAVLIAALALSTVVQAAEPVTDPALLLGTDWYPEQWPEARWETDLALMEAAHLTFVRVGCFNWSTLEPREGEYHFDALERAVAAARRHHLAVVVATPTAAPPAWLTTAYPQTLLTLRDGRRAEHGAREQFNWSDPTYRRLVADLVTRLADHFGHDPAVIAWQIDNEYQEESYDPATRVQFQDWLKARYGTLDTLNARWTTAYWSQTYQDWRQIPFPTERGANPGLMLAWKEFITDTWRSYQRNQLDILRARVDPRQKITTNFLGEHDRFDHYRVFGDLDFASWDEYVGTGHFDPLYAGAMHDIARGVLRRNFWVMETQPGYVNWATVNNSLDKGEVRALTWNAVGHGADALGYWQWRSAMNGQEQYHGSLLGADGTPAPIYGEVAQVGAEFGKAAPALAGTTVVAEVALLHDYPSRWAIDGQRHHIGYDPLAAVRAYYPALHAIARSVDIVSDTVPLTRYKLVVAPALNVITPAAAANLIAYVRGGGHLVLGPRSGMKDEDNSFQPERQPGPLADLLGARVAQFYALETPVAVAGQWGAAVSRIWADMLKVSAPDAEVLMRYGAANGWLDAQPAVVTRRVGTGRITYIGADLDMAGLQHAAEWMTAISGVVPVLPTIPPDIDVAVRIGAGRRVTILTNYGRAPSVVALPGPMYDMLAGGQVAQVTLARYGVAVLSLPDHSAPAGGQ